MPRDNEIWKELDAMAASYQRMHGVRPNQMQLGAKVAEQLEPDRGTHPLHLRWVSLTPGVWFPAHPVRPSGWWERRQVQRACRQLGGHWWHPADPMIAWVCCQCGVDRDGSPKDGT